MIRSYYPFLIRSYYPFFNAELEYELTVWVPDSKGAPLTTPLIYMVGGLGGLMPGIGYDTIFKRCENLCRYWFR